MARSDSVSVFLVDDHPLVREWLTTLIEQQEDMRVCGEADTVESAYDLILSREPDLVIVDISLSGQSGIELIQKIKNSSSQAASIVLSMHEERHYAERAIRAGARGYIMKCETAGKITSAIRTVRDGKMYISEKLASLLAERISSVDTGSLSIAEVLSDRELQIFELIGQGNQTREIAELLSVSMKTVQAHCARIKDKLGYSNATELLCEAVRWYERHG